MSRAWLAPGMVVLATCVACSGDGAEPRRLSADTFDEEIGEICREHGPALDALWDEVAEAALDETLSDDEFEALIETGRRRLVRLKEDLIAELRDIEPADASDDWRDAVDEFEEAIERAASGARVDVRAEGLGAATDALVDDFGLDGCF